MLVPSHIKEGNRLKKIILIVLFSLIIVFVILSFSLFTPTTAEYAYILAAKENESQYSIIAYDIKNEKHSIIKTDAYLIKDDLPNQLLAATCEDDYLTLYSIHNGEMTTYREKIYCPDIEFTIAYIDSCVYYTRRNWFGLYDIVRLLPDGTLFQYTVPGDGLHSYQSTGSAEKIPFIADVDQEGRIIYTYRKSGSGGRVYMSNLLGEYHYLNGGFHGIWMNPETVLFWSDELKWYFPDTYKFSFSDESNSFFFKPVFCDTKKSVFSSTYANASIKDENTISIACEIYPVMYPFFGYPKLSFGLFNAESGKCIAQYNIQEKDLEFCDYKIYWE